jgi:uroporphyrinogen-III synthase
LPDPVAGAVLVTRPEPGAAETARRLVASGFVPILAPALAVATLTPRLPSPRRVQAVLVTSGNALGAFDAAWHGVMLLAVGDATAARARAAGFTRVLSAGKDAEALAALALGECRPAAGPLLLACGAGQGVALTARLRMAGLQVVRRIVYAARPATALPAAARAALAAGAVGTALFFSPATARAFAAMLTQTLPVETVSVIEALAISPPTAAALAPLPWRRIRVASHPDQDALLALLGPGST